jgi:hypothetical protein
MNRHPRPTLRAVLRRYWLLLALFAVGGLLFFLASSSHPAIWPVRNVLLYQLATWWQPVPMPDSGSAELHGCVQNEAGEPLAEAWVLVAEPDGTTHSALTDATGCYRIGGIPAGRYVPVATAPGYGSVAREPWGWPIQLGTDETRRLDIELPPQRRPAVSPGSELRLGEPLTVTSEIPQPTTAVRREIFFDSAGQPNQPMFLYTPVPDTAASADEPPHFPTLIAVYPGPAGSWDSVSVPLAAAGYTVVGIGPAYSFELEADVDEIERLVGFVRAGRLPQADAQHIALLGGSYSSLHVLLLIQRDADFAGVVLLGPPTDLFDIRRRFEQGTFSTPYPELNQALIALGWPNTATERYWRYSGRYHVPPDTPPLALMHSRSDEVVPFAQSQLLVDELERRGLAYESLFFEGSPHYLLAEETSAQLDNLYRFTLDFLDETVSRAHDAAEE